jgi:tungstate transport system ATP-binding protein
VESAVNVEHVLTLRDVIVRRSGRTILDVPELRVERGQTLSVIGPNGAGKSTLLLQLALLERPSEGQVLFEGAPVWGGGLRGRELALRRRMAVVFQEPLLLDRSVTSNVETGLRLRGVGRSERRVRAARWLDRFGVGGLAGAHAHALSGGESQRVSLARAFALEPEVLLLDEPFSALDQPTRQALIDDMAAVLSETHLTTVLVTHDHDEAARLGDRVAVLMHGRIVQSGAPQEVFGGPADEEVAAFVGVETMLEGQVTDRADGRVVLAVGPHLVEAVDARPFEAALVCLRPEDVSLSRAGEAAPGSARNHLPGRVRRIVAAGADARVEVDCGVPVMARITRRSLEDLGLEDGSEVVASFKATAVHLIPK